MFPWGDFSLAQHEWPSLQSDSNVKAQLALIDSLALVQG